MAKQFPKLMHWLNSMLYVRSVRFLLFYLQFFVLFFQRKLFDRWFEYNWSSSTENYKLRCHPKSSRDFYLLFLASSFPAHNRRWERLKNLTPARDNIELFLLPPHPQTICGFHVTSKLTIRQLLMAGYNFETVNINYEDYYEDSTRICFPV